MYSLALIGTAQAYYGSSGTTYGGGEAEGFGQESGSAGSAGGSIYGGGGAAGAGKSHGIYGGAAVAGGSPRIYGGGGGGAEGFGQESGSAGSAGGSIYGGAGGAGGRAGETFGSFVFRRAGKTSSYGGADDDVTEDFGNESGSTGSGADDDVTEDFGNESGSTGSGACISQTPYIVQAGDTLYDLAHTRKCKNVGSEPMSFALNVFRSPLCAPDTKIEGEGVDHIIEGEKLYFSSNCNAADDDVTEDFGNESGSTGSGAAGAGGSRSIYGGGGGGAAGAGGSRSIYGGAHKNCRGAGKAESSASRSSSYSYEGTI